MGTLLIASSSAQQRRVSNPSNGATCGPVIGQILKCPKFGFTYQILVGWVERTSEMQEGETKGAPDNENSSSREKVSTQTPSAPASEANAPGSQTLLAIFERPPGAAGETINSAVIIAAESRSEYPQVKTAADYFGPISDLAEQSGLKPVGDPYAFPIGNKQLVREDFTGQHGKLPICQSTLVAIERGKIVSFTFVGGNEDDVNDLIANLQFQSGTRAVHDH
jgi:hypothetical protein